MTVTIEVINNRAFNLLSDMENLDLIRVNMPINTISSSNEKLSDHLAGALKLSDEKYEYYQRTLQEGRNEWNRNIY
jgi:hypothetical protein